MKRSALPVSLALTLAASLSVGACKKELPPTVPPPPPAAPPPPAPPPPAANVAPEPTEEEKQRVAQMIRETQQRTEAFDRSKLPLWKTLLAFSDKTRQRYDEAFAKAEVVADKVKAKKLIDAAHKAMDATIAAHEKKNDALDAQDSHATMEFHIGLYELRSEYPDALKRALDGDRTRLDELRGFYDERAKKLRTYFDTLAANPGSQGSGKAP